MFPDTVVSYTHLVLSYFQTRHTFLNPKSYKTSQVNECILQYQLDRWLYNLIDIRSLDPLIEVCY